MYNREKVVSSVNNARKTKQLHVKELYRTTFSHHIQKQAQRLKYKTWNSKTPRRKRKWYTLTLMLAIFLAYVSPGKRNKKK